MTSYDRHAGHNSPYRTTGSGQGIGRNPGLNGVRTSIYQDDPTHPGARSTTALAAPSAGIYSPSSAGPNGTIGSPTYTPGARSMSLSSPTGEVPLQDFGSDGLAPPPPVSHSWARIDRWTEANFPELKDQLCEGCTLNDINELEFDLDCSLPIDVRESITIHDGQERGGMPTGIIFGSMLLDCEEILYEWNNWKTVNQEFMDNHEGKASTSILGRQESSPEGAVQKVYAHPGWIPLARDWNGNNIAVDLAPGPTGKWGQIILCGRDYDCKYVVARSWAAFLAMVADDLESPHWYVDEETQELKLKDPRAPKREPGYFDILRVRNMQKYRRLPRKQPPPAQAGGSAPGSPSSSNSGKDRGRTQSGSSRHSSPGTSLQPPKSRLSRVNEEVPSMPIPAHTKLDAAIKGKENGTPESMSILDESVAQDKTAAAIKALDEVSLNEKAENPEPVTDGSDISRPPLATIRRSIET